MIRHLTVAVVLALLLTTAVAAQDRTAAAPPRADAVATDATPQVPDAVKSAIATLQMRAGGLADARAVLQKELDAVLAELTRNAQAAQQACAATGYELTDRLVCVKKSDAKTNDASKSPPK